jgi:DUF4097 and DUF4098 domain-containing protein YvlB
MISLAMFIAGGVLFAVEMQKVNWDFSVLDKEELIETDYSFAANGFSPGDVTNLKLSVLSTQTVLKKEGSDFTVKYYESEFYSYDISFDQGTLTVKENSDYNFDLRRPFISIKRSKVKTVVTVPADFNGDMDLFAVSGGFRLDDFKNGNVKINAVNGSVTFNSCEFGSLSVDTDNGAINLDGVAADSITISTDNGAVNLSHISAGIINMSADNGALFMTDISSETLTWKSQNGAIDAELLTVGNLTVETDNGTIDLSIKGIPDDYFIYAVTQNGKVSAPEGNSRAEKKIRAVTDNGFVKIRFV